MNPRGSSFRVVLPICKMDSESRNPQVAACWSTRHRHTRWVDTMRGESLQSLSANRLGLDLRMALDRCPNAIVVTDPAGVIQYVNRQFTAITGYHGSEVIGKNPRILKSGRTSEATYQEMWATISAGRTWQGRILNSRKPGYVERLHGKPEDEARLLYWAQLAIAPLCDPDGMVVGYVGSHVDITARVRAEERRRLERNEVEVRARVAQALHTPGSLRDRLFRALDELLRIQDLDAIHRGGIFLLPETADGLDLFVTCGEFGDDFLRHERRIRLGACLCGRAAESGELLISDDCFCDPRHEHSYAGMNAHGHYIVPLRVKGHVLGVMFIYTDPHPPRDESRLELLHSVADIMALAIANDRLTQHLIQARDHARLASAAKDEFLANMSHEIRTPLTAILGFAETLNDEQLDAAGRANAAAVIHRNGEHLLNLVNDLLDLSKIEAGRFDMEVLPVDPRGLVEELVEMFAQRANGKGLELTVDCGSEVPAMISTDPTRLRQILTNLLSNAIKFTSTGTVTVEVHCPAVSTLAIEVRDTGIGIDPEKAPHIFDPFMQADASTTRRYGGTGLGLAISRRLAESLEGSLTLVHSEQNAGSCFRFEMPVYVVCDMRSKPVDDNAGASAAPITPPTASEAESLRSDALAGMRVLLAEDNRDSQRLIHMFLQRVGAELVIADNGQEALDQITQAADRGEPFDAVLMDMQMPVLDGYDATRRLRELGHALPIIALTAHALRGDREKCLDAGCDDYATKPIDRFTLVATIVAQISHHRMAAAVAQT
jgi:PAS domain S-box-containing protein